MTPGVKAQPEIPANPLVGAENAHVLIRRSPASKLPFLRRWMVRLCYLGCKWTSEYSAHTMGIYTDYDAAEREAGARAVEDGELWQIHTVPINSLLPDGPVQYGEFGAINAAAAVDNQRHVEFEAVRSSEVQRMRSGVRQLSEILRGQRKASTL